VSVSKPRVGLRGKNVKLLAAVALVSLLYLAGLVYYATVRPIDGDEGFYTAARLVSEGKTPYRDFFYQQAPLLPYLYSWIWAVHPRSLVAMRLLSAACGGIAVFLWGICLVSVKRLPTKVAVAAFAAVLLNPYWVSWNGVVKTFAVANLLMTIATIFLYAALRSDRLKWYFAGGLALGTCVSVRSLYGLLIPSVLLWTLFREWRTSKPPYPRTLTLLAGEICGLLPMIVSFLHDPRAFIFNNIRYHSLDAGYMWLNGRIIEGYQSVGHTLSVYFATVIVRLLGFHPHFTIELGLAVVGGVSLLKLRKNKQGPYTGEIFQLVLACHNADRVEFLCPQLGFHSGSGCNRVLSCALVLSYSLGTVRHCTLRCLCDSTASTSSHDLKGTSSNGNFNSLIRGKRTFRGDADTRIISCNGFSLGTARKKSAPIGLLKMTSNGPL